MSITSTPWSYHNLLNVIRSSFNHICHRNFAAWSFLYTYTITFFEIRVKSCRIAVKLYPLLKRKLSPLSHDDIKSRCFYKGQANLELGINGYVDMGCCLSLYYIDCAARQAQDKARTESLHCNATSCIVLLPIIMDMVNTNIRLVLYKWLCVNVCYILMIFRFKTRIAIYLRLLFQHQ